MSDLEAAFADYNAREKAAVAAIPPEELRARAAVIEEQQPYKLLMEARAGASDIIEEAMQAIIAMPNAPKIVAIGSSMYGIASPAGRISHQQHLQFYSLNMSMIAAIAAKPTGGGAPPEPLSVTLREISITGVSRDWVEAAVSAWLKDRDPDV